MESDETYDHDKSSDEDEDEDKVLDDDDLSQGEYGEEPPSDKDEDEDKVLDDDDLSQGEYGEEPPSDKDEDKDKDDDVFQEYSEDEGPENVLEDYDSDTDQFAGKKKVIQKSTRKRNVKEDSMKLEDFTDKILKRFNLNKLKKLAEKYDLDVKRVIDPKRKRKTPKIDDYIKLLLNPQDYGYSPHRKSIVVGDDSIGDAGEDAEATNILEEGEIDWVLDKIKYGVADSNIIKGLVRAGEIKSASLYHYQWVDSRKAKRPQPEPSIEGVRFFKNINLDGYTPPDRDPTGPIKIIGDNPSHGRTISLKLEPGSHRRGPPPGYESFHIGERVSFLGEEVYKGFLTKSDNFGFYISGVNEPFYYEKIDGHMPTAIPDPEFSFVISTKDEDFSQNFKVIAKYWPKMADIYYDQQLEDITKESDPNIPRIVGLVLDGGLYSWVYDFTMNPSENDVKQLIPVFWNNQNPNYDSITQYVSVAISGIVEGIVIGYTTNRVRILTDQGEKIKISLGEPSLKVIPGRGDQKDPSIPTKEDILHSHVTPDIRLAMVEKLFNNFADVIPDLIGKEKKEEDNENIPALPPFITVFRTWDEYFTHDFQIWLRAKYHPMIVKNLPFDKLKQMAYQKSTMGLGENDLDMIHNKRGLDLVNSLDENYKNRLIAWRVEKNNPRSFFHLSSNTMLQYLKDSKNKTVFEIEIERGLYNYEPYQPLQPTRGFKHVGYTTMKRADEASGEVESYASKSLDLAKLGGKFISTPTNERQQDPYVTKMIEKNQLAKALTRMIRSFMIKFPLREDKIYEELVEEEINRQFNKLVPLTEEDKANLDPSALKESTDRLLQDLNEFKSTHGENLRKIYAKYEKEWTEKLDNPEGKVEKIIVKQEIMRNYTDQLNILREQEIEIKQDPGNLGKIRLEHSLLPEAKRELIKILGDRTILENDILELKQEIQILGSSPRTKSLSAKGHDVRSEIKQFERNCMAVSQEEDTTRSYLCLVLRPLIFISRISSVSDYSNVFRSKIANRTYPIDTLLNSDLFHYFPEFVMKDNDEKTIIRGKKAISDVLEYIIMKFVQDFINAKYLGPRKIDTRPDRLNLGFEWASATISPQKVCEEQTDSGKTLERDGYQEKYYKKMETKKVPVEGSPWLEKRIVTETEIPFYKTIEDGNLIIEHDSKTNKFICHSRSEIILQIAAALKENPYTEIILDPRTAYPYSSDFIARMKERYQKEINQVIEKLPENFVPRSGTRHSEIISESIYNKNTGIIVATEKDEEGVVIDSKPWNNLASFLEYVRLKGKVLVLFCNNTSRCIAFKESIWSVLASEYPNVTFLDIDTQGINYGGSDIATEYKSEFRKDQQLVMKVPSIFSFVNGKVTSRSDARIDDIRRLIGDIEDAAESDEEDIELVGYKEEIVKSDVEVESDVEVKSDVEVIEIAPWTDLDSFLNYIRPLGYVLVLLCDASSACTNFKKDGWSKLILANPNITFLDVDIQDITGSEIFEFVKNSRSSPEKATAVMLFYNGTVKGHSQIIRSYVDKLIAYINKKKNEKKSSQTTK